MASSISPCIVIEDLPALETLTPEELAEIFGAGRKFFRPSFEALESRQMFSASPTATLSSGVLQIDGTAQGDQIVVCSINNQVSINNGGVKIAVGGAQQGSVGLAGITKVQINGHGGINTFEIVDELFKSIEIGIGGTGHNFVVSPTAVTDSNSADVLVTGRLAIVWEQLDAKGLSLGKAIGNQVAGTPLLNRMPSGFDQTFASGTMHLAGDGKSVTATWKTGPNTGATFTDSWDTAGSHVQLTTQKDSSYVRTTTATAGNIVQVTYDSKTQITITDNWDRAGNETVRDTVYQDGSRSSDTWSLITGVQVTDTWDKANFKVSHATINKDGSGVREVWSNAPANPFSYSKETWDAAGNDSRATQYRNGNTGVEKWDKAGTDNKTYYTNLVLNTTGQVSLDVSWKKTTTGATQETTDSVTGIRCSETWDSKTGNHVTNSSTKTWTSTQTTDKDGNWTRTTRNTVGLRFSRAVLQESWDQTSQMSITDNYDNIGNEVRVTQWNNGSSTQVISITENWDNLRNLVRVTQWKDGSSMRETVNIDGSKSQERWGTAATAAGGLTVVFFDHKADASLGLGQVDAQKMLNAIYSNHTWDKVGNEVLAINYRDGSTSREAWDIVPTQVGPSVQNLFYHTKTTWDVTHRAEPVVSGMAMQSLHTQTSGDYANGVIKTNTCWDVSGGQVTTDVYNPDKSHTRHQTFNGRTDLDAKWFPNGDWYQYESSYTFIDDQPVRCLYYSAWDEHSHTLTGAWSDEVRGCTLQQITVHHSDGTKTVDSEKVQTGIHYIYDYNAKGAMTAQDVWDPGADVNVRWTYNADGSLATEKISDYGRALEWFRIYQADGSYVETAYGIPLR